MTDNYIFDMDGLLVDSEPYWKKVEKDIFSQVGITLTDQMCLETVGFRLNDIVNYWYQRYPWTNATVQEVGTQIVEGMKAEYESALPIKPGVLDVFDQILSHRHANIAVCSSSPLELIKTVMEDAGLDEHISILHSAENDPFGKPHPFPYIACSKKMGSIDRTNCIAFEDSTTGAISAKAASMFVVAVPEGETIQDQFSFCDVVLDSLEQFDLERVLEGK